MAPLKENFMDDKPAAMPDSTAMRVALWRAQHVQVDPPPHVLEDELGLRLAAPDNGWRHRPDMDPEATRGFRAGIVARARFIEDMITEQAGHGVAPPEMLELAREAGFRQTQHVSAAELTQRYFTGRTDDLRPASAEAFLVAISGS